MKKYFLFLLAALISSAVNAQWTTDFCEDGIYYNCTSENTVEVTCDVNIRYTGNIVIPETVTHDGTEYTVTSIGDSAFSGCQDLTSVVIPNSVTSIGFSAFGGNHSLESFTGKFASDDNRCLIIDGELKYFAPAGLTAYEIPNSVTSIGSSAFSGYSGLTSVVIPGSVTSIGNNAFRGCSGLTSAAIPSSVTSIGDCAFVNCKSLESFTGNYASDDNRCLIVDGVLNSFARAGITSYVIPNSVTSIGMVVFAGCQELTSVEIPNSVTSIGGSAFSSCYGLTSMVIPNSVTSIGNSAFNTCIGLTSVEIPNSVTSIGNTAFGGCSDLTSVVIPNSVTSIGNTVFAFCSSLTSVEIPSSVTSIGSGAFDGCTGLTKITCLNTVPPSIKKNSFNQVPTSTCVVKVPASAVDAYKAADGWKDFMEMNIVPLSCSLVDGEAYTGTTTEPDIAVTYTRDFKNTNWQAFFVPFSMDYDEWKDLGVMAELTSAEGDALTWTIIGEGGSIEAGKPYIFRPAEEGEAEFLATPSTLLPASEKTDVTRGYVTLSGTYEEKTDMRTCGAYALAGGQFKKADSDAKHLNPFRIFLTYNAPASASAALRIIIDGEETNAVDDLYLVDPADGKIYNLQGMEVGDSYKGIMIKNGKKLLRK